MKKIFSLIAVGAALVLAGCNQNSGTGTTGTSGTGTTMSPATNTPAGTNAAPAP